MKRLLQALLILIVVIVAAYLLLVDGLVKKLVETEGSKALGAPFEVAAADFNLFPTVLALRSVTAANPRAVRQNLFTADKIVLRLETGALLQRQLIAEHAVLHGLRFNQPRAGGGADAAAPSAQDAPPSVEDIQRQQVQAELGKIAQNLTALRDRWRQRLQALPDQATLAGYRARGATAELNAAREQMRTLQAEFERDRGQLQQQLASARAVPQLAQGGAAPAQLTQALIGPRLAPLLRRLTDQLNAPPAAELGEGEWPVLARKTELDGELAMGGAPLRFTGTIDNATPHPGFWRQPIAFKLANAAGQPGTFSASGTLDYREGPRHDIQLSFEALPVRNLVLGNELLRATLASAVASGTGRLNQQAGRLDLELQSRFEQARFNIIASDDPAAQAAAEVLGRTQTFDLRARAEGSVQQPQVTLTSSLDQPLAAAVGQALRQGGGEALRARLQRELGPEMADIQRLSAEFNALQEQLRQKLSALGPAGSW